MSRPFLPPTQPALPERQSLPDRSSHSSLGARGRVTSSRRAGTSLAVGGGGAHPGRAEARPSCFARRPGAGWCFQGYRVATGGFGLEGVRAGEDKERLHLRGSCGLGSFTVGSFACFSAPSPSHLVHNRCYTTLRTENTHVFVRYTFFIRAVAPPRLVSLSFGKTSLTLLSLSPVHLLWFPVVLF